MKRPKTESGHGKANIFNDSGHDIPVHEEVHGSSVPHHDHGPRHYLRARLEIRHQGLCNLLEKTEQAAQEFMETSY